MDAKFQCVVGIRVMSTIIATKSLEAVLRKGHKITKFFLTIDNRDHFRMDLETIKNCIYRFHGIEELCIQLEVEAV